VLDGLTVQCRYTLRNSSGMVVQVIELGAAITSLLVPDKHGDFDDVTPGFDTVAGQCTMSDNSNNNNNNNIYMAL